MKVLFDHQIFVNQKVGGISRYITDLKTGLEKQGVHCRIAAHFSRNFYLAKEQAPSNPFVVPKRVARLSNRFLIAQHYLKEADLVHPTYYNIGYLRKTKKPVVITVHDLIYFKYPQLFPDYPVFRRRFEQALQRCDGIICISAATKKALEDLYDVSGKNVKVIHHGIALQGNGSDGQEGPESGFFLYVGARHHYKNFSVLLEAFGALAQTDKGVKLVVVGGEPLSAEEQAAFARYPNNLQHLPLVTDDRLEKLFASATALVVTSLEEGFCYPVVEAVLAGTPVVCANIDVLKEVSGGAADFYEATRVDSLYEVLRKQAARGFQKQPVAESLRRYYSIERMCHDTKLFYSLFA